MLGRRSVLGGAAGMAAMAGLPGWARAAASGAPLAVLTPQEGDLLGRIGEAMATGSRAAGIAHFVDAQLAGPPADSMLTLRYLDWPGDAAAFYRDTLAAAAAHAGDRTPAAFDALVAAMLEGRLQPWAGPPQPLAYFAIRADAVDVVYGTEAGFERLGVEYLAHIAPERPW
jgi:hypothetical protein